MSLFGDILSGAALDDLIRVHGETATVQRVTETPDEYGSQTEEWNDLTELTGHFYALSGREVAAFRKLEVDASYGIVCKPQTEMITEKDRVIKETTADDPGAVEIGGKFYLIFYITWVQPMAGSKTGCLRLALRERK
jgi:head-tail adaptor